MKSVILIVLVLSINAAIVNVTTLIDRINTADLNARSVITLLCEVQSYYTGGGTIVLSYPISYSVPDPPNINRQYCTAFDPICKKSYDKMMSLKPILSFDQYCIIDPYNPTPYCGCNGMLMPKTMYELAKTVMIQTVKDIKQAYSQCPSHIVGQNMQIDKNCAVVVNGIWV